MTRICITGGPRTGKTTLALRTGAQLGLTPSDPLGEPGNGQTRHTDDLMLLGWSEASEAASVWFDEDGPWIIEGVAVSRALRKWRERNPGKRPPVDRVIYLSEPHVPLTPGQASMAEGVRKVHDEIEPWLRAHGVATENL